MSVPRKLPISLLHCPSSMPAFGLRDPQSPKSASCVVFRNGFFKDLHFTKLKSRKQEIQKQDPVGKEESEPFFLALQPTRARPSRMHMDGLPNGTTGIARMHYRPASALHFEQCVSVLILARYFKTKPHVYFVQGASSRNHLNRAKMLHEALRSTDTNCTCGPRRNEKARTALRRPQQNKAAFIGDLSVRTAISEKERDESKSCCSSRSSTKGRLTCY